MTDKERLLKIQKELEIMSREVKILIEKVNARDNNEKADYYIIKTYSEKEVIVVEYLLELGIPVHLSGFNFIKMAIMLLIDREESNFLITKEIYPEIALKTHSTSDRVERAIRNAIRILYENHGDKKELQDILSNNQKCRPSNSEFLAFVAEKIRLKN